MGDSEFGRFSSVLRERMTQSFPVTYDKKVFSELIRPLCPSRTHGSPLTVFGSGGTCVNTGYAIGIQAFEAEAIVWFDEDYLIQV
jgi:hypothetical protein